jgi:hypothetical protein
MYGAAWQPKLAVQRAALSVDIRGVGDPRIQITTWRSDAVIKVFMVF